MKKIIFAGITAVIFSCGMGAASAYSYNREQATHKAVTAKACGCATCACDDCTCTDCANASCDAACREKGAGCTECVKK